jgi:hypothetical protein
MGASIARFMSLGASGDTKIREAFQKIREKLRSLRHDTMSIRFYTTDADCKEYLNSSIYYKKNKY